MSITGYLDYRAFLRAWLAAHPRTSLRALARRAGCSPSLLSRVIAGERDLDPTRIGALADALRLEREDAAYLADLVELESPSLARRQAAWTRVTATRRFGAAGDARDDAVRLFARWEYGAIWKLASCAGFRADPEWIRASLRPAVSLTAVRDALDALESLGLLARDAAGELVAVPVDRATPPQVPSGVLSEALREWHRSHLHNVEEALALPSDERYVVGLTLAVGAAEVARIRAAALAFVREVAAIGAEASGADRVVQIEVGLVPLSRS